MGLPYAAPLTPKPPALAVLKAVLWQTGRVWVGLMPDEPKSGPIRKMSQGETLNHLGVYPASQKTKGNVLDHPENLTKGKYSRLGLPGYT